MIQVRYRAQRPASELGKLIALAARASLRNGAMVALQHARATSRFTDRTGKLRGSIAMGRTDTGRYGARYIVGAKPKYALFVEAGTKAHIIEPRRKSVLRFKVAGQWVAAKKVNHPGTRARKFMYEASEAGGRAVIAYLNRVLR